MFVSEKELNADLCLESGQVFRFQRTRDGWIGVDGSDVIRCKRVRGGWEVSSSPNASAAREFFQLERSAQEICKQIVSLAGELKPFVAKHRGLRVLRQSRADETLLSFVCSVNNNIERITRLVNWLGGLGREIERGLREFPSLKRIEALTEFELRSNGFGYRGRTIPAAAREAAARGADWLDSLRQLPYADAHEQLMQVPGVGPKVADCVCLIGLGHEQAVPVDTHLWNAATEMYFPEWKGKSVTASRYKAVGDMFRDKFGELAGWAHQYLFYDRVLARRRRVTPVFFSQ